MKKIVIFIIGLFILPGIVYGKEIKVTFSACVDGDTASFIYNKKIEKFRFLAIDTPESTNKIEPYGKEASNYTCTRLKNAKEITVEFDPDSSEKDKYGRYLAWIFVDGSLLQEDIIEEGYAEVAYLYGDYKYTKDLQAKEKIAKDEKLNIWSNYEEEKDEPLILITILGIIIILCIFSKKFRNKIIRKTKTKIKNEIKKMNN